VYSDVGTIQLVENLSARSNIQMNNTARVEFTHRRQEVHVGTPVASTSITGRVSQTDHKQLFKITFLHPYPAAIAEETKTLRHCMMGLFDVIKA